MSVVVAKEKCCAFFQVCARSTATPSPSQGRVHGALGTRVNTRAREAWWLFATAPARPLGGEWSARRGEWSPRILGVAIQAKSDGFNGVESMMPVPISPDGAK